LPILQHNGLLLQQYGKSLAMEKRNEEAIILLKQAGNYYKDEYSFIALGDAYKALGETNKAEVQYQLAANMVPHKFYPLYLLAKLYNQTGQHKKALALARQILTKEIKVLNFAEKKITTFGFNQPFNLPLDLAFDSSYNLYVVDGNRNKIIVFDQRGVGLFEFGNEKNLLAPSYIAINDKIERIYVSQGRLHQISVFDLTGNYLFKFGQPGVDDGEFAAPQGMAIDSMGNLYVADMLNSRIQIFDQNGTYLSSFKFVGDTRYPYENPKDLEFGTDGNLYILDQRKALLISYTPEGKFLFAIGGNSRTTHPLGFSSPSSIDIDKKGKIYITDQLNRRLTLWQILTKSYLSKNPVNERDRQNILKLLE